MALTCILDIFIAFYLIELDYVVTVIVMSKIIINSQVKVSYHFRKNYEIRIEDNVISIKVPHLTTQKQINDLLLRKKRWINNRLNYVPNNYYANINDKIYLFGNLIDKPIISINQFYLNELNQYIHSRINTISQNIGIKPSRLTIRAMTTRWGSCSSSKRVTINLHLTKAPKEIIDYVLTHELCHIKHMNHSLLFWALVSEHSPQFRAHEKWLKEHGRAIMSTEV